MSYANSPRPLELTAAFLDWYNATALLPHRDGPGEEMVIGGAPYDLTAAQAAELRSALAISASIHRAHADATQEG